MSINIQLKSNQYIQQFNEAIRTLLIIFIIISFTSVNVSNAFPYIRPYVDQYTRGTILQGLASGGSLDNSYLYNNQFYGYGFLGKR